MLCFRVLYCCYDASFSLTRVCETKDNGCDEWGFPKTIALVFVDGILNLCLNEIANIMGFCRLIKNFKGPTLSSFGGVVL
uniref:Putative ovule protein n=1 Tax=Solanum chacoense TaxID=4108 RepID=A0A0V0IP80_SOLCH